jgi:hypothetical protein
MKIKKLIETMGKPIIAIPLGILIIGLLIIYGLKNPSDYRYAVASENYEGRAYEYYTQAICEVVAVSEDETEVYINHKGNVYCFYTDGYTDCKVGDKWNVTFNEAMEIVNVR